MIAMCDTGPQNQDHERGSFKARGSLSLATSRRMCDHIARTNAAPACRNMRLSVLLQECEQRVTPLEYYCNRLVVSISIPPPQNFGPMHLSNVRTALHIKSRTKVRTARSSVLSCFSHDLIAACIVRQSVTRKMRWGLRTRHPLITEGKLGREPAPYHAAESPGIGSPGHTPTVSMDS